MVQQNGIRLNKFISESGLCSRREADRYIEQGKVFINGRLAKIGDQVYAGNKVVVNGHGLEPWQADKLVFIALNKPVGVTSTTEQAVKDNIIQYVNHPKRIFPIGRLDKDSQGLIFLTNDGDVVNKILRAGNNHEKEYVVTVDKPLTENVIQGMANGVPMLGVVTKKCKVVQEGPQVFRITLIQGLNRQIRRMCEHFGYEVKKLERVRIMNISLNKLPVGDWRDLTTQEIESIYAMVKDSAGEQQQAPPKSKPKPKPPVEQKNNNPDKRKHKPRKSGGNKPHPSRSTAPHKKNNKRR